MSLTPKQVAFVEAIMAGHRGKEAAIRAGYAAGSAAVEASRLLRSAKVSAELDRRRAGGAPAEPARNPKRPPMPVDPATTPAEFLKMVMAGTVVPSVAQLDAAKTLARIQAGQEADKGKKATTEERAKKAMENSVFRPSAPPLHVIRRP